MAKQPELIDQIPAFGGDQEEPYFQDDKVLWRSGPYQPSSKPVGAEPKTREVKKGLARLSDTELRNLRVSMSTSDNKYEREKYLLEGQLRAAGKWDQDVENMFRSWQAGPASDPYYSGRGDRSFYKQYAQDLLASTEQPDGQQGLSKSQYVQDVYGENPVLAGQGRKKKGLARSLLDWSV